MSIQEIFELVAEGRTETPGQRLWICSLCLHHVCSDGRDESDRMALLHCLAHARELLAGSAAAMEGSTAVLECPAASLTPVVSIAEPAPAGLAP